MSPVHRYCRKHLCVATVLSATNLFSGFAFAQDASKAEKKPEEVSKVATVEVTPGQTTTPVGSKLQFKAVGKDSQGQALRDTVKFWFAAPFDAASADDQGEVSFVQPGEITVGAVIGKKIGYAHVSVGKPRIASIGIGAPSAPLAVGSSHRLTAVPRNPNGDPRTDIALTWTSRGSQDRVGGLYRARACSKTGKSCDSRCGRWRHRRGGGHGGEEPSVRTCHFSGIDRCQDR